MYCSTSSMTETVASSSLISIRCSFLSLMSLSKSDKKNGLAAARTTLQALNSLPFTTTVTSQRVSFLLRASRRSKSWSRCFAGSAVMGSVKSAMLAEMRGCLDLETFDTRLGTGPNKGIKVVGRDDDFF